jgi:hypothetical protein
MLDGAHHTPAPRPALTLLTPWRLPTHAHKRHSIDSSGWSVGSGRVHTRFSYKHPRLLRETASALEAGRRDHEAVIEVAAASGLSSLPGGILDALGATSLGTGQLIREAPP